MNNSNFPRGIEVVVGPYILNENNRILLIKSPKWQHWTICGGHVEPGETLENAVKRETKEELGIDIEITGLLRFFEEFVSPPAFKRNAHFIFFDYIAKALQTDLHFNEEISEAKWFDIHEALKLDDIRASNHRGLVLLQQWLSRNTA